MLDLLHPGETTTLCSTGTWYGRGSLLAIIPGSVYFLP
jgi:hypothetical protein